jgi:WD repeat-containing protein 19
MVWSLDDIRDIEDKRLVSGHLAMMLGDYSLAQDLYLQSSQPVEALHMRRDLLQWEQALALASRLAPGETPTISREYGQQLEFTGDYPAALQHYERALLPTGTGAEAEEHNGHCRAGIARMALRCGDVRKGLAMCREVESRQLLRECADILESMKQLGEAAQLYEAAQYHDKAAHLYIKLKNWTKVAGHLYFKGISFNSCVQVGNILPHISSPKIQLQYAKAKEADGKFKDAVLAYEHARDYDSAVGYWSNFIHMQLFRIPGAPLPGPTERPRECGENSEADPEQRGRQDGGQVLPEARGLFQRNPVPCHQQVRRRGFSVGPATRQGSR